MEKEPSRGGRKSLDLLLEEAKQGSREALGEFLQRFRDFLLVEARLQQRKGLGLKCSHSDIAQETLLAACRDFDQFRGATKEEFLAWLLSILKFKCAYFDFHFRHTQKRQVSREIPLDDPRVGNRVKDRLIDPRPSPGEVACLKEDGQELREVLAGLPKPYRRIIALRFGQGLSFEEISARVGCSAEAARKLFERAVRRIAASFESSAA